MCFTGPFGSEMTTGKETGFYPVVFCGKILVGEISSRKQRAKGHFSLKFKNWNIQAMSTDECVGPMVVGGATQLDFS